MTHVSRIVFAGVLAAALMDCGVDQPKYRRPARTASTCSIDGQERCLGTKVQVCDGGLWVQSIDCAASGATCSTPSTGIATCSGGDGGACSSTGATQCSGDTIQTCNGTNWVDTLDCSQSDKSCDDSDGSAACTTEVVSTCSNGNQKCLNNAVMTCSGGTWTVTDPCGSDTCVQGGSSASCEAEPPPTGTTPEGESCFISNECLPGLECVSGYCSQTCTVGMNTDCDAHEVCFEIAEADTGVCIPAADTGVACYVDDQCTTDGDACFPVMLNGDSYIGSCAQTCPGNEIGHGVGSCDVGDVCLTNNFGFVETEQVEGVDKTCTTDANCTTAQSYACLTLNLAAGGTGKVCARPQGVCGTALPLYATASSLPTELPVNACGVATEGSDNNHFCGVDIGAGGTPAEALCLDLTGSGQGVCAAVCSDPEGGADRSCGVGYICAATTAADSLFFDVQHSGETQVSCTNPGAADVACTTGYSCTALSSGNKCAKPAKMCTPN